VTGPTHISFAGFAYLLVLTTTGVALSLLNGLVVGIAALLPDIDNGASMVGRLAPAVSLTIERKFGHRTLTHSAVCIAGLALVLLPLLALESDLYVCFLAGYASHPFLDTMTITGVKLFYPFSSVRCVFPLEVNHPSRYRTRTGSKVDKVLGLAFLVGCIPTFLVANEGYERFVRIAQRNIESAVRDYNEFSRSCIVFARVSGHNLLTKEHLEGWFEIAGALNNHTLLFRGDDGRLHSLGNEYQAEYVAEHALCERGDPVRVVIRRINLENLPLAEIESHADSTCEGLLFGELSTPDHYAIPQEGARFAPVTGSSGTLRFNYASVDDIKELQLQNVYITGGTLTLRTLVRGDDKPEPSPMLMSGQLGTVYTHVGFETNEKEPVELLCGKGDTVIANQVLARWGMALDVQARMRLNNEKIAAFMMELEVKLSDLQVKTERAQGAFMEDSIALNASLDLTRKGFVPDEVARKAGSRYRLSMGEITKARQAAGLLNAKFGVGIRKLTAENEMLAMRHKSARERCELRSPALGIVVEIRQEVHNGKLHGAVLLKKL
jgi:inner membrane protein